MLVREHGELDPVGRAAVPGQDFLGRPTQREQTKLVLVVPFVGDKEVFRCRARTFSHNPPRADIRDSQIRLVWQGDNGDVTSVRAYFEASLDKIEGHLAWSRADIGRFNAELPELVTGLVRSRRSELLADRNLEAGLGFPVRRREGGPTFWVPIKRTIVKAPRLRSAGAVPFSPEPVLSEAHYNEALSILANARNALERTPSMTARLNEEQIRDLLLMALNSQLEGQAGGELFNGAGKTDILIRVDDRNIFIAECKIWRGPKTVREGLDQLLSYLVWRDTKAALLLFIRSRDETAVIVKAVDEIQRHGNCKRTTAGGSTIEDRRDFVFQAHGDTAREIRLAFLPFSLRVGDE